jgi:hypothetical protein
MRRNEARRAGGAAHAFVAILLSTGAGLLLAGCALVDLSPFSVSTYPDGSGAVLSRLPAIVIRFSEPVVHDTAESAFSVTADGESVEGDPAWEGNRLTFTPVRPFSRGMRHVLRLEGPVRTTAGRTFDELIVVSFYVGTDARPPIITEVAPEEGGICGVTSPLRLTFSASMDEDAFADAFSLSPEAEHGVAWNGDRTQATITPEKRWTSGGLVRWSLTPACLSSDGVAIGRAWTGTFLAQEDASSPSVVETGRAVVEGATVLPLPGGPSEIVRGDSLRIVFSEDIDPESLEDAFSLSPPLEGTLRRVSSGVCVFVPSEDWDMGREYVLEISTDLRDGCGNPMRSAYRAVFTPAIPIQSVEEIALGGDLDAASAYPPAEMDGDTPHPVDWLPSSTVGIGDLDLSITIRFARGYDPGLRPAIAEAVELSGFYPEVASPRITQVDWLDGRTLVISFTGFSYSAAPPSMEQLYYLLTISSGVSRTTNQEGSYLREDVTLLLESGPDS